MIAFLGAEDPWPPAESSTIRVEVRKVCAWCGVELQGSVPAAATVSHGICERCMHEQMEEDKQR